MPASSSRRILLFAIFVVGLLGVVGYFAFDTKPIDAGDLEVFAPPKSGKALVETDEIVGKSEGQGKVRVHVELRTQSLSRWIEGRRTLGRRPARFVDYGKRF